MATNYSSFGGPQYGSDFNSIIQQMLQNGGAGITGAHGMVNTGPNTNFSNLASIFSNLGGLPSAIAGNPGQLAQDQTSATSDLSKLSQYGIQGSQMQDLVDALNKAGINTGPNFTSAITNPNAPTPATGGTPGPISPTNPSAPVVPAAPTSGPGSIPIGATPLPGNIPFTPNTAAQNPALPYPGENTSITNDPNQQAIINQQQIQSNLLNQIMQQVPGLVSAEQGAQQQTAGQALTQSQNLTNQEQGQLGGLLNQQMQNTIQGLTTGDEGNQLRNYYNNLGILDSGAFSSGLASAFTPIEQQSQQAIGQIGLGGLQNQQDILNSLYGTQSQLGTTGLNQIFGGQANAAQTINDLGTSSLSELFGGQNQAAANAIAASIANNQYKAQQNQGLGSLVGTGLGGLAGFFAGGPMGSLLGGSIGGGLGSSIGSLF